VSWNQARVLRWLATCLFLVLAGCGDKPARQARPLPPPPEPELQPADSRSRAAVHTELAANYYTSRQYKVALEELDEALRADSGYAPAYNVLGLVHMDLNQDGQAEKSFLQALRINPQDSDVNNNYGWFLCTRGREADSIKYFLAALRDPLYATPDKALVNAGVCSRKMGDNKAADEYFVKALAAAPNQPKALLNLAELRYQQNRLQEARTHLNRLMQTSAATPAALWLGVKLERKLGDRGAEASYAIQLKNRFPDAPETKALTEQKYE
jgi:type IV pilus assembly protein PilF